jgi:hypothetical protein
VAPAALSRKNGCGSWTRPRRWRPSPRHADARRDAGCAEPHGGLVALGDPARRRVHAPRRRAQVPLPLRGGRGGRGVRHLSDERRMGRARAEGPAHGGRGDGADAARRARRLELPLRR